MKHTYTGILLVKKNSKRLPKKNYLPIKGKAVFEYAHEALKKGLPKGSQILVLHEGVNRPINASHPDEPLFDAVKWAYKNAKKATSAIVNIQANCPLIKASDVQKAIERFELLNPQELRAFTPDGLESGLIIMQESYLMTKKELSTYQAAITIESTEIHYKKDFDKCKQRL